MNANVSAPGKLLLFGDHAVVYGQPCIVTAINKRVVVSVEELTTGGIHISTPGNGNHEFVNEASSRATSVWKLPEHISITVSSPFSGKYGFGSSSAVTVATLKALAEMANVSLTQKELFDLALQSILKVQGVGSGFDIAAACFGNTIFYKNKGEIIQFISHNPFQLIVGYTGKKANTVELVKEVEKRREIYREKIDRLFNGIGKLVIQAQNVLIEGDYERVGKLMDVNQEYLRDLGVSSEELETLIAAAKKAGAWGAKLSGAGGGDCMIAIAPVDKKNTIYRAITEAGGEGIDIETNEEGVRCEI